VGIFITQKNILKLQEVRDIKKFIDDFDYNNCTKEEGELSLKYTEKKYDTLVKDIEFLDHKSDLLIKYLGLGTGGLGIILGYFSQINYWPIFTLFSLGFVCWVISVILSLASSKPSAMPYPMTTQKIFKILQQKEGYNVAVMKQALSYGYACIILRHTGIKKGELLHWAYIGMVVSMCLFFLSLILGFVLGVR